MANENLTELALNAIDNAGNQIPDDIKILIKELISCLGEELLNSEFPDTELYQQACTRLLQMMSRHFSDGDEFPATFLVLSRNGAQLLAAPWDGDEEKERFFEMAHDIAVKTDAHAVLFLSDSWMHPDDPDLPKREALICAAYGPMVQFGMFLPYERVDGKPVFTESISEPDSEMKNEKLRPWWDYGMMN